MNRQVLFLDNSKPIPFVQDPKNPNHTYQIGFSLSNYVKREIQAFGPTMIHLTCPDCTALHLIEYARRYEIPIMGTYHSNIPEYMEHYVGMSWLKHVLAAFFRHQYNFLQALYVPTPFIQRHLSDSYRMDQVTNLRVWGHGVDTHKFHPCNRSKAFRKQFNISSQDVVLLWVSRLVPEKRPDIFARVVQRLYQRGVSFRALVIGAGPCEDQVKSLPNTTFCGWMNEDQLSVAYASADVFLFPSAVETFGLVTLEAAASGLPVIVETGCSGHLVQHGVTGYACQAGKEDAFYEATFDLVTNHTKRRAFSQASRELSSSWEKRAIVRKMLDNYSRIRQEFFADYSGRHANRDACYRKPESFVGGSHPRPLLLIVIEWLFIAIFHAIWNMTHIFIRVQQIILPQTYVEDGPHASSKKGLPQTMSQLSIGVGSTIVEFSDADLQGHVPIRMVSSDDETASTSSSTREEDTPTTTSTSVSSSSSSSSSSVPYSSSSSLPAVVAKPKPFGDRALAHALAKSFIQIVQVQCRMESYIRNVTVRSICLGGISIIQNNVARVVYAFQIRRLLRRRRGGGLPQIQRSRSDVSDLTCDEPYSGTSSPVSVIFPSSFEGKSRLRRNCSTVGVWNNLCLCRAIPFFVSKKRSPLVIV